MKIAIVVPIVGNFGKKGFYHSQEIGLGKEIAKHGHEVQIYKCVPRDTMQKVTIENFKGITVKYIPTLSFGPHGIFNPSLLENDTEVVFVFSDTQITIPRLYRHCKKYDIKFIPYIGIAHSFQKNIKSKMMDLIFRLTTLKVYRQETVLVKTEYVKEELRALGVKDIIITPVGLDFNSLKSDFKQFNRLEIRKKWGFKEKDLVISFVARLKPEKRPLQLIDIFKGVKSENKKLLIVGEGPLRKDLDEKIKKEGLEDKVLIISKVKYEDIWEMHYIADYFLNLRDNEIFGMAIMEAVYYKSYVVALSAPGPDTILQNMKSHVICRTLPEITEVISTKNLNDEHLEADSSFLKHNFGWENCVKNILYLSEEKKN